MTSKYNLRQHLMSGMSCLSAQKLSDRLKRGRSHEELSHVSPQLQAAILEASPAKGPGNSWPLSYRAPASHVSVKRPLATPVADALLITRFHVDWAEKGLLAFLGHQYSPFRVLDLSLQGFEQCWHSDLGQALDLRSAIFSRIQVHVHDKMSEFEHLVVPILGRGEILMYGWFNRLSGATIDDIPWAEARIGRMCRGHPIDLHLPPQRIDEVVSMHATAVT